MHNKPDLENNPAPSPKMAANVSDMMLQILAIAVSAALIKMHTEEASLKFRLANHPPASVWTRLIIGHSLTGFGLTFGTSRLYLSLRQRLANKSFGHWLWIIISLYLLFYISASVLWSSIHLLRNPPSIAISNLNKALGRVIILTSQQACFDQFAWLIASIWISFRLLYLSNRDTGQILDSPGISQKSDHSIAIYSGFVVTSTIFQRFIESAGF